jgi:hypothetical protein
VIKTLDGVLELYEKALKNEEVDSELVMQALVSLKSYDSPAKYPIATMLRQVYREIHQENSG